MTDKKGCEIAPGAVLWHDDGYAVIVRQYANGDYYGQLVCEPEHPCAEIPYALNDGRGYTLIKETANE